MRLRKFFCAIVMMLSLALAFSAIAYAEPDIDDPPATNYVYVKAKAGTGRYYLRYTFNKKLVKGYKGVHQFPEGSGNYYYVYKNGRVRVDQWCNINGKLAYSGNDGRFVKGFQLIDGKLFFFKPTTGQLVTGWIKYNGNVYFASPDGIIQKGFIKVGNYVYYMNPEANGARTYGWKTIAGKVYFFSTKAGRMLTGFKKINGKYYFFNSSGVRQTGLQTINNNLYYFSNAGVLKTGSRKIGSKYYYFASSGVAQSGWVTINSKKYYYKEANAVDPYTRMIGAWYTDANGNKYYLNEKTGAMVTGKYTIGGVTYEFGDDGVLKVKASWRNYTPDYIRVNLTTNVITVYSGAVPIRAFRCSPGVIGSSGKSLTYEEVGGRTLYLRDKLRWHELMGPSWGQYCEHLSDDILFHSVPYQLANNPNSLRAETFNKLGESVSHGCIRLACIDAYYIWKYCPGGMGGTKVRIDYFGTTDPIKPTRYFINNNYGRDYVPDPTDPNYNNNGEKYLDITSPYVQFDLY